MENLEIQENGVTTLDLYKITASRSIVGQGLKAETAGCGGRFQVKDNVSLSTEMAVAPQRNG